MTVEQGSNRIAPMPSSGATPHRREAVDTVVTHIPVADAPLANRRPAVPDSSSPSRRADDRNVVVKWAFVGLLALELCIVMAAFAPRGGASVKIFTLGRYVLWASSASAIGYFIVRRGIEALWRPVAFIAPFFAVGLVSGALSYDPVDAARQLIFWALCILTAAVIGQELRADTIWRTLFWTFVGLVALSAAMALLQPSFGQVVENRSFHGMAWRGVFAGKNWLGNTTAYLFVIALFATSVSVVLRLGGAIMAMIVLFFANSQGSNVTVLAVAGVTIAILLLRRTKSTPGVQAMIFGTGSILVMLFAIFGLTFVLEALGRDPTLTGRTVIWAAYFNRAVSFWLIGAGPGSFEGVSGVTYDVMLSLLQYGSISSPHNMYIAAFGEVGIFGLLAFVLALASCAFVVPFVDQRHGSLATAAAACAMMFGGLIETHEVFGTGIGMTMLVLLRTTLRAEDAPATPDRAPEASDNVQRLPVLA